jgi:hypothetical protein
MTTQLMLVGMFIEFVKLESPSSILQIGSELELKFRLCEQSISAKFDIIEKVYRAQKLSKGRKLAYI